MSYRYSSAKLTGTGRHMELWQKKYVGNDRPWEGI